ncbi:MAG TPA: polysaccharide deacetylase family protein, partial [Solirubrobacteraceae bacterium]|nr:polysaccharide deacetylase family protein [Solirubrobacteraceae bacterium]
QASGGGATARRTPVRAAATRALPPARPRRAAHPTTAALRRFERLHLPVYCGGPRRYVAFTFDDGPGVYTRLAVRVLHRFHVPATFFLVGRNLRPWRGALRAETRAGELGDHTWTHPYLPALARRAIAAQLADTKRAIARLTGRRVALFRPPYGARDGAVDAAARRLGLIEVLWNVDSADSLGASYAQIVRNVRAGLHPGAIVLMHENRGQTIRALRYYILPALHRSHLQPVTVARMLALDPPSLAQLSAGANGCRGSGRGVGLLRNG